MACYIWWGIACAVMTVAVLDAIVLSFLRQKRKRILTPGNILFGGTFLSGFFMFFGVYHAVVQAEHTVMVLLKSAMLSLQYAMRIFAIEGEYVDFIEHLALLPTTAQVLYTYLSAVVYTLAPLLTFGFILSFFKNITAYRRYLLGFYKHTHVFSELNEKTLALASSIMARDAAAHRFFSRALIVFTDVTEKDDEITTELCDRARELGAVLLSRDLSSVKFRWKRSPRRLSFYLISYDEAEKMRHAESIMHDYDLKKVELFVFSDDIRLQLLLATKNTAHMRAIRINDIQALIYHELDTNGTRLFERARDMGNGEKLISVVLVGLGKYGTEMLKALVWFAQLPGYRIKITVFDRDPEAKQRFTDACPELMSDAYNGKSIEGEPRYEIDIRPGVEIGSCDFTKALLAVDDATLIFVALGNDKDNLSTAVRIRTATEGAAYQGDGTKPDIETVIYDEAIADSMGTTWQKSDTSCGVTNFKGQPYNIRMIGDLAHFYAVDTVLNSELVEAGRQMHLRYASNDSDFWRYEYNYRSSIARALHERLRKKVALFIPGVDKPWGERTPEERLAIGRVEHLRWSAYMRTEGYQKGKRNDLARRHHNLVPTQELSDDDLRKDA